MRWSMKKHNKLKNKDSVFANEIPCPWSDSPNLPFILTERVLPSSDKQACYLVDSEKERNRSVNMLYSRLMRAMVS